VEREWIFRPRVDTDLRPAEWEAEHDALIAAVRAAHGAGIRFAFELESGPEPALSLIVRDPASARWVERTFRAAYGAHQWRPVSARARPAAREAWYGRRLRTWPTGLRGSRDGPPLVDLVALAFGTLGRGLRFRLDAHPLALPAPRGSLPEAHRPPDGVARARRGPMRDSSEPALAVPVHLGPWWSLSASLSVEGPPEARRRLLLAATTVASLSRTPDGNGLAFRSPTRWIGGRILEFPATESELCALLPSPRCPAEDSGDRHPDLRRSIPLGRALSGGVVALPIEASQGRHLAILGETGMGKSSLLVALARRIVAGAGLVLLDPLGETARVLRGELPRAVAERVVWIAPGSGEGLNALADAARPTSDGHSLNQRGLTDLVHALRRVRAGRYRDTGFWGPRLEEMLTRALAAAAALPAGTLVDAHRLLAAEGRGFRLVPEPAMEPVRELAERIRARPEDADGARRLLYEIARDPVLVEMLCDGRERRTAADLVRPGRIVLIAGDAEVVGESTSRYLLSVYLALIWSGLLARPDAPKTFVVLDEAQWFAHESVAEMLRLGRRRNVHVVLATQALGSLPEPVAEAVWTNVADFVAFRGAPAEARELARATRAVTAETLLALPRGEAVVLLGKGESLHFVRTVRLPRPPDTLPTAIPPTPPPMATDPGHSVPVEAPEVEPPDVTAQDVIDVITARAARVEGDAPFPVSLADLRSAVDPGGRAVRAAGSLLTERGAIVRADRSVDGTQWWIDPSRISAETAPRGTSPDTTGTDGA